MASDVQPVQHARTGVSRVLSSVKLCTSAVELRQSGMLILQHSLQHTFGTSPPELWPGALSSHTAAHHKQSQLKPSCSAAAVFTVSWSQNAVTSVIAVIGPHKLM